jgi:mono/diheme cytochrome c family protein
MRKSEGYLLAVALGLAAAAVGAGDVKSTWDLSSAAASRQAPPTTLAAGSRGQLLYENHCTSCHASIVHIRENRNAKSMADLHGWVQRWADELRLKWSNEEIDDVAQYLAHRFYKFGGREEES